jgi:hypothetical protein
MHVRIKIVLLKLVFRFVKGLEMEQRAEIALCVKLKKAAAETFEM